MKQRQPTINELIQAQEQDIEKFKAIIENYKVQNPAKAEVKAEEFVKKLELKQTALQALLDRRAKLTEADREREAAARKAEDEKELAIQARIEAAREEGRQQALKEQMKKDVKQSDSTK